MSESPSLTPIKQGTRRGAALRLQQCQWCDDRAALNGFAARSCGGMVMFEKLRGVEFFRECRFKAVPRLSQSAAAVFQQRIETCKQNCPGASRSRADMAGWPRCRCTTHNWRWTAMPTAPRWIDDWDRQPLAATFLRGWAVGCGQWPALGCLGPVRAPSEPARRATALGRRHRERCIERGAHQRVHRPGSAAKLSVAHVSTGSACTLPCAALPTTARRWNNCAGTSLPRHWPKNGCRPILPWRSR